MLSQILPFSHRMGWFLLRCIDLRGCYRIPVEAVQHLCSSLSTLDTLDIRNCKLDYLYQLNGIVVLGNEVLSAIRKNKPKLKLLL